jgi:hypothetical protein
VAGAIGDAAVGVVDLSALPGAAETDTELECFSEPNVFC